jgi:hypothetical protein
VDSAGIGAVRAGIESLLLEPVLEPLARECGGFEAVLLPKLAEMLAERTERHEGK